jgi:hypothetical protein
MPPYIEEEYGEKAFAPAKRLYGVVKGDVNGLVIVVDAVGEVKDAGRAGTEGGVVEGDDPVPVIVVEDEVVVLGTVGADEMVLAAGTDVDAAAAAAMVPLRSHGFGGEPIVSNRRDAESVWRGSQVCVLCCVKCGCDSTWMIR